MFVFLFSRKSGLFNSCSSSEDLSEHNISWSYDLVQVFHPPQKFESPPFLEFLKLEY
jgi:hypothetical protein